MLKKLFLVFCFSALAVTAKGQSQNSCGVERWPVKTLADSKGMVAQNPVHTMSSTVSVLNKIVVPGEKEILKATITRFPSELHRYKVSALVLGFKLEKDSDFHIVIADPKDKTMTMVAEIPSGNCVPNPYGPFFQNLRQTFEQHFGKVGKRFHRLAKPELVEIDGVGFIDVIHGQTGVAKNGFELHPVLSIRFASVKPVGNSASVGAVKKETTSAN